MGKQDEHQSEILRDMKLAGALTRKNINFGENVLYILR